MRYAVPMPDLDVQTAADRVRRVREAVAQVVRGKAEVIELCLVAVVAGGHVLLEDVPGVGKTTLAHELAGAIGGSVRRVQFTSDLQPGDITGVTVLDGKGGFQFRPGPLFANVVLADEINRATPKTQSALLEAMGERHVTVDGVSHPLPRPFLVVGTQNPHEDHGTFALPESQLDRFLLRLHLGYPDRASERAILRGSGDGAQVGAVIAPGEVEALGRAALAVTVHPDIEDALLDLVERTRTDPRLVRGASTRAAEALYRAVRALALARGRAYAIPEDLVELVVPVLAHRVIARADGPGGDGAAAVLRALLREGPSL